MPENQLAGKLKLKPGLRAAIINPREGYLEELLPAGMQVSDNLEGRFDWLQLFVRNKAELETLTPLAVAALQPQSLLWISFPKGSSKLQSDLTRDQGWEVLQGADLKWINLISVNATWSAFSLRPYKPGEARQSFR